MLHFQVLLPEEILAKLKCNDQQLLLATTSGLIKSEDDTNSDELQVIENYIHVNVISIFIFIGICSVEYVNSDGTLWQSFPRFFHTRFIDVFLAIHFYQREEQDCS